MLLIWPYTQYGIENAETQTLQSTGILSETSINWKSSEQKGMQKKYTRKQLKTSAQIDLCIHYV